MDPGRRWRGALAALLLAAGVATGADAAVRYWFLQGVVFDDGATAAGSFAYDDVAREVTAWNVSVGGSPSKPVLFPFTYVPGNSTAKALVYWSAQPTITFTAPDAGTPALDRLLRLTPVETLDGSPATVALDVAVSNGNVECTSCGVYRNIVAGELRLGLLPVPVGLVDVIEFYHAGFDHYFVSADPNEIHALDTGFFAGWARTGHQFKAYAAGSSAGKTVNPVCRFYGLPAYGLDSHFYTASALECRDVNANFSPEWQIESGNVFQIDLPDTTTGACPAGKVPVYRVFNQRPDANHRYTTSAIVRAQMEAAGWIREGYGPDATIMCAAGAP